jgi:hypothetical protein
MLTSRQRDGAAHDNQVVATVTAGDHHLWPVQRADDTADDHLDGVPALHLLKG